MRVAALYDIHGNLPALETVLADVDRAHVDRIVVGGDVLPGPMPVETLARLAALDRPVDYLLGNGELAVLAQIAAPDPSAVTYWGTTSGVTLPEPLRETIRWSARALGAGDRARLASWPRTVQLEIPGLGAVLFCHGTPRSEIEIFTRLTPAERLAPIFEGQGAAVVICGHTHSQFDRRIGGTRVVNAGSVGMPFGRPGADWLLLGPDIDLRHSDYDLTAAAARIRATSYPQAEQFATGSVLSPPSEEAMLAALGSMELR